MLLIVISDPTRAQWAQASAAACGIANPTVFNGTPAQCAMEVERRHLAPTHIILDIGDRGLDVLPEIDQLAQQCKAGTRVIAVGNTNDILLYRGLLSRGVMDYLTMPSEPNDIARILTANSNTTTAAAAATEPSTSPKRVITFFTSASGDGASTAALNTAYALSQLCNGRTVVLDMDYQYGMVAKQLNLQSQYGIRELFDFPERGIDTTLIKRMVVSYGKLHVITAPTELRFLPNVSAEVIRDLIVSLKQNYDNIVIDLPHLWTPWAATLMQHSTHLVMVSQLWLKSVSHAARMMRMLRELNIPMDRVVPVINRSGAKFKEAIEPKDFERVCGVGIRYSLSNDIRTVTAAEGAARTVLEMDESPLARDIMHLARSFIGESASPPKESTKMGLFSRVLG